MKKGKLIRYLSILLFILFCVQSAPLYAASMEDYCLVPPYVKRDVAPNIMMLMDVSEDMNGPAYPGTYVPYDASDPIHTTKTGYFNPPGCYEVDGTKFVEAYKSTSPNISYTFTDPCPSSAPFRGNLMNWATMSKFDILEKVIIGGNTTSKQSNAHTLGGISGTWTDRTYGGCVFRMDAGKFIITETSPDACPLLFSTPEPIASLKNAPDNIFVAMRNTGDRVAAAEISGDLKNVSSGLSGITKKIVDFALNIWNNIHFVSEAEAADCTITDTVFNSTATVGLQYSFTMTASPTTGAGDFVWTFTPAAPCSWLPAPVISGNKSQTATATGTPDSTTACTFTVTAKRPSTSSICTAPPAISKTITPYCPSAPIIDTASLDPGYVGQAYSGSAMSGRPVNGTWSATGLPPGLSMSSAGVISGTPTTCSPPGVPYNVLVTYTDAAPCSSVATSKTLSMTITNGLAITQPAGTSLSDGQTTQPYTYQLLGSGGTGSYTWSISSYCADASPPPLNCLPFGLSLDAGTGLISGTPVFGQGGQTFNFRVTLTDQSTGCSMPYKDVTLHLEIWSTALNINSLCPPAAIKRDPYSYTVTAQSGTLPYLWSLDGGTCNGTTCTGGGLPAGISLNQATGVISGTAPNTTSSNPIRIRVTDSAATPATAIQDCTFQVVASIVLKLTNFGALRVDMIEEDFTDSNGNDIYDSGTSDTFDLADDLNGNGKWDGKKGVFQKYYSSTDPKARWGLTNYNNSGVSIQPSGCIPVSPASSFYTNFQNIQIRNSQLSDGLYADISYYGQGHFTGAPASDPYAGNCGDPIDNMKCRKNFVLIITAGANVAGSNFNKPTCTSVTNYNAPLVQNGCFGFNTDLRDDKDGKQSVLTYIVNTMGTAHNNILQDAADAGGGKFYNAATASDLEAQLDQAFKDILGRAASGTAASVLASGEGQGANLVQAVFYPRTQKIQAGGIFDTEVSWIGRLTNLWYYVDPFFQNSSIREDTTQESPYRKLNLANDYAAQLYFDSAAEQAKATLCEDTNGDGSIDDDKNGTCDSIKPTVTLENLKNLWEAGLELWRRDLSASPRTIYTTTGSDSDSDGHPDRILFSEGNAAALQTYLQAADANEAQAIIKYMHGEDNPVVSGTTYPYRERSTGINLNGDTGDMDTNDPGESAKVWKLADVLNSTPKIASWIPLNTYDQVYGDTSYGTYLNSSDYQNRGMMFAGANDGMLHAFKLGSLNLPSHNSAAPICSFVSKDVACLSGTELGKEVWAFIPKNALPYLKYYVDQGYCHIYSVDLTPYVFDASIGTGSPDISNDPKPNDGTTWRTIVIGGMRFGGACKPKNVNCSTATPDSVCAPTTEASGASVGYSSYFALDITVQDTPILLWEFSDSELGFTTTGPSVVKIGTDRNKNGKWFVVFGSGPTGPISADAQQFLGKSDQPLKLFVFDLKQGPGTNNTNVIKIPTGIEYAFAGSMLNATHDFNLDYQDDAIYIPYVKKDPIAGTWTQGGVGRLLTNGSSSPGASPGGWAWSKVIDNIGPVTSSVVRLQHKTKKTLWLFFGTGRYYFEQVSTVDDQDGQRHLFGITEPCFENGALSSGCVTSRTIGQLTPVNLAGTSGVSDPEGWYIILDASAGSYRAERVITDPLSTTTGLVFFTTYKPYNDVCSYGGKSFIWSVKYDTGAAPGALLKGMALLQVSTGSIEQVNLSTAFTEKGERRTSALEGVPPTSQGLSLMSTPPPVKRTIHIRER